MGLALGGTVPVLVFKMGQYPLHHGTVGIVRSLGKAGVPVYAVVEDRFAPAAMSRYLTGAFVWKTCDLKAELLVSGLAEIGGRLGRPAILLPTDDTAAAFIAEHAGALEKRFLFPRLPCDLPRRLANKRDLHSLCKNISVPCPQAAFPGCLEDVCAFIERTTFPVVVKAAESRRLPNGARTISIAQDPKELLTIYREAESQHSPNLIFQEYIPPSSAEDWIFHGYCNPQTRCFIGFTGKKLRSYPPFAGMTTLGVSAQNEPLIRQAEKLLSTISYGGIMDLDYRFDKRDGQYKLLDFNPRIGANFRMFEDCEGVDVARALYLDMTGRTVPRSSPLKARTFIVDIFDLCASLGYMRHGALTPGTWWRSLKGKKEIAWFRWDDTAPALMMCVRLLFRIVGRVVLARWAGHSLYKQSVGLHLFRRRRKPIA